MVRGGGFALAGKMTDQVMIVAKDRENQPVVLIESDSGVADACAALRDSPRLGVDTESNSMHAFRERVCTIQVTGSDGHYIFDTIAVSEPALGEMFADPSVEKIFHGGVYDLGLLKRDFGYSFAGLFDTAIAAELLGFDKIGLAALVEKYCGVVLAKKYTTCDWARRPFSEGQIEYLYQDTRFLFELADALSRELAERDLTDEARFEFERLADIPPLAPSFARAVVWNVKGIDAVETEAGLRVLNRLFLWRQDKARELDRPPFKVLGNQAMLEIASRLPRARDEFLAVKGVTRRVWDRFGRDLVAAVSLGLAGEGEGPPPRPAPKPFPPGWERRLTGRLKDWRNRTAERLGGGRSAVLPTRSLKEIVRLRPRTPEALAAVEGLGAARFRKYGGEILRILGT